MFFTILTLLTALMVAGVAAWFSVVGILAIFSGLPVYALAMGTSLEIGKLVTASWLYRNWDIAPIRLKYPLVLLVVILMFLTSMGIFGLLSKAHIDQGGAVSLDIAKVERLDQQIASKQRIIDDNDKITKQLDESVQTLLKYDRIRGKDGAIAVRESQKQERAKLTQESKQAQAELDKLYEEKLQASQSVKQFEREIGPIKYITELLFDEPQNKIDSAVRFVILTFVFVFDPLAVLLLIAANFSLMQLKNNRVPKKEEPVPTITPPVVEQPKEAAVLPPSVETKAEPVAEAQTHKPASSLMRVNNKVYPRIAKIRDRIKDIDYNPLHWTRKD